MKKISISKTDTIIVKYILRVVLSTIASVLLFSYIFAQIIYKLDLSLDAAKITGVIVCGICAVTISYISLIGIKNNQLLMGALSSVPLIFYSLLNTIFNNDNYVLFLIKLVIVLLLSALIGYLSVNKKRKFKVK